MSYKDKTGKVEKDYLDNEGKPVIVGINKFNPLTLYPFMFKDYFHSFNAFEVGKVSEIREGDVLYSGKYFAIVMGDIKVKEDQKGQGSTALRVIVKGFKGDNQMDTQDKIEATRIINIILSRFYGRGIECMEELVNELNAAFESFEKMIRSKDGNTKEGTK